MNTCIICLATPDKHFPEGLERLKESIKANGFTGKLLCWQAGQFPAGCRPHGEVPFAFKPSCFREADSLGMELVLWLDVSCVVVRNLAPVFRKIAEDGYFISLNERHRIGEWISDEALESLGVSREETMKMPEINGGVIGLNLKHATAREFLKRWSAAAANQVAFRGSNQLLSTEEKYSAMKWNLNEKSSTDPRVRGHRHDQSVAGILASQLGMKPSLIGVQLHSVSHRWIRPTTIISIDRTLSKKDVPTWSSERVRRDRYIGAFAQLLNVLRNRRLHRR